MIKYYDKETLRNNCCFRKSKTTGKTIEGLVEGLLHYHAAEATNAIHTFDEGNNARIAPGDSRIQTAAPSKSCSASTPAR